MKELLTEFLQSILDEVRVKAVKVDGGDERIVYFGSQQAAQDAIRKGTHRPYNATTDANLKSDDDSKTQVKEPLKIKPEKSKDSYEPPAGEKAIPKVAGNPNAKPIIKVKDLDQTVDSIKTFNTDAKFLVDGISDKEFKQNTDVEPATYGISPKELETFLRNDAGKTIFPSKYIKVLSRLLSTKPGSLTISSFTDASGAGTLSSTAGELLTLMGATIEDNTVADEFFSKIEQHVKQNSKLKESIIDTGWVKSAKKVRTTLRSTYDKKYGRGNWQLTGAAWDIEDEVEALGLPDYKKNKGFSTDVYFQVTSLADGGKHLDEVSLKKDLNANLLNSTSGRVADIMVYGAATPEDLVLYNDLNSRLSALAGNTSSAAKRERTQLNQQRDEIIAKYNLDVPDNVKVEKVAERQQELHDEFLLTGFDEIQEFVSTWKSFNTKQKSEIIQQIVNNMNQKESYGKLLAEQFHKLSRSQFKSPDELLPVIRNILGTGDVSRQQKFMLSVMYGVSEISENSEAKKILTSIIKNSHTHSKEVRNFLLTNKSARKGLLLSIRDAFPLKSLFEGEEKMVLGDVVVDDVILKSLFNTNNFDDVEQKLTVRDEPPPPSIVYRTVLEGQQRDIPIAEISSRPDGIGYGGAWKLEMAVHGEFGNLLKKQMQATYPVQS
jgi:hypothetical protein